MKCFPAILLQVNEGLQWGLMPVIANQQCKHSVLTSKTVLIMFLKLQPRHLDLSRAAYIAF